MPRKCQDKPKAAGGLLDDLFGKKQPISSFFSVFNRYDAQKEEGDKSQGEKMFVYVGWTTESQGARHTLFSPFVLKTFGKNKEEELFYGTRGTAVPIPKNKEVMLARVSERQIRDQLSNILLLPLAEKKSNQLDRLLTPEEANAEKETEAEDLSVLRFPKGQLELFVFLGNSPAPFASIPISEGFNKYLIDNDGIVPEKTADPKLFVGLENVASDNGLAETKNLADGTTGKPSIKARDIAIYTEEQKREEEVIKLEEALKQQEVARAAGSLFSDPTPQFRVWNRTRYLCTTNLVYTRAAKKPAQSTMYQLHSNTPLLQPLGTRDSPEFLQMVRPPRRSRFFEHRELLLLSWSENNTLRSLERVPINQSNDFYVTNEKVLLGSSIDPLLLRVVPTPERSAGKSLAAKRAGGKSLDKRSSAGRVKASRQRRIAGAASALATKTKLKRGGCACDSADDDY